MKKTAVYIFLYLISFSGISFALDIGTPIHTPETSKPILLAKSHFLPYWQEENHHFEDQADCSAYPLTSCKPPMIPDTTSRCPDNSVFFSRCICPDYFKPCDLPTFGSGVECDGKYLTCEEDTERACQEQNPDYTNSCPSGMQPDPKQRCSYDSAYGLCCNTCSNYPDTEIKDGYEASKECTDCDGITHYQLKPAECVGFADCANGPDVGAKECKSGEKILYSNCKPDREVCQPGYIDQEKYWNGE